MAIPACAARAFLSIASRACRIGQLCCRGLNFMNILLEGVCYFGRVLFALTICSDLATGVPGLSNLVRRLVHWGLVRQTLLGRSLRRATSMDLGVVCGTAAVVSTRASAGPLLLAACRVAGRVPRSTRVQMLLIARRVTTTRTAILIANTAVFCSRVLVTVAIPFRGSDHVGCLARATLHFIRRQLL